MTKHVKFVDHARDTRATGELRGVAFAEEVTRCVRVIASARGLTLVDPEWCARAVMDELFRRMSTRELAAEGITYHRVLVAMATLGYLCEPGGGLHEWENS